jgi:glycosyltransferase involved in cell wall biosynthesis
VTRLSILKSARYLWDFNSPRSSRHDITCRRFIPLNKINWRLDAMSAFNPLPPKHFDLVHAFNRVPLGPTPYVIGYESHLPRAFGMEGSGYFRSLTKMLLSDQCRGIYAISNYALDVFRWQHAQSGALQDLERKLFMHYPSMNMPDVEDHLSSRPIEPLRLLFVGRHFARKGGCVALRIAETALARKLPIEITIVSSLEMGATVWTDPARPEFFDPYRKLLTLPNVTVHPSLPNAEVIKLLAKSHLSILTTMSDTFGFSAIESMAHWTPVLGTRLGALREFINHRENGLLVEIPLTPLGDWIHSNNLRRHHGETEDAYRECIESLAEQSMIELERLMSTPALLSEMRAAARSTAEALFDARVADGFWDDVYQDAVTGRR